MPDPEVTPEEQGTESELTPDTEALVAALGSVIMVMGPFI